MKDRLKIIFMGSPEFAACSLRHLVSDGFNIAAVITGTDKARGRGLKITGTEVKNEALKHNIPVFQPTNLKDEKFIDQLTSLKPDLGIVVAFRMLPEVVWKLPRLGTINLHASMLPDYRGAAPINHAIMNGEKSTGLTTFFLQHEIDTGEIILQEAVPIADEMDAGELHDIMMVRGANLLSKTVSDIESGSFSKTNQSSMGRNGLLLHKAPRIFTADCRINWNRPAAEVCNFIRGLSPRPGAWTVLGGRDGSRHTLKIFKAGISNKVSDGKSGVISIQNGPGFSVGCGDYFIELLEVQLEGKKRMKSEDFLKGFKLDTVILNPEI